MPPYVSRFLTLVRERIDLEGDVFVPLAEASLVAAIEGARELGEEAVAVCLDDSLIVDDQQTALLRSR